MSLIIKKNTTFKIPRTPFLPSSLAGLALWLKADAGVNKASYNYVSQIIISGTSNPSFAGTYTANGVPTYNFGEGFVNSYYFTGPAGKNMVWNESEQRFFLSLDNGSVSFESSDGVNWSPFEEYTSQVVITGFTGIYVGANGTYNRNTNNVSDFIFNKDQYYIEDDTLYYYDGDPYYQGPFPIATTSNNYASWEPVSYPLSIIISGPIAAGNGTYTRLEALEGEDFNASFNHPTTSKYITQEENGYPWYVRGTRLIFNEEGESSEDFLNHYTLNGGSAISPDSSNSNGLSVLVSPFLRSIGSPTSITVSSPSGSISGTVTNTTANTDFVTAWADQSGQGRNAVEEENDGKKLLVEINGKSFVGFNNTNMILPPISFVGTIFAVVRFNISSTEDYGSRILYQSTGSGDAFQLTRGLNSTNIFYLASVGDGVFSSVSTNNNTNYLIGATFNSSSASLFLNGTSVGSGPIEENYDAGDLYIGQGEPYKMAEIIVYNQVLTTPERQQVEAYLNTKYQIY